MLLTDSPYRGPGFKGVDSVNSILSWSLQGSQEEGHKGRITMINVLLQTVMRGSMKETEVHERLS